MLELKKEKKLYGELKKEAEKFFDFTNKEINYDFNGFDKVAFIKILVKIMILMVLIAMVLM